MGVTVTKIGRGFFSLFDRAFYNLAIELYRLFITLANTKIFEEDSIRQLANRVYFFLGLIMIFKVSTSILQYIMNPDSINDKKIGAGKLLSNIVVVLLGIVFIPYAFEAAYGLQRVVLKENTIGKLILGGSYTTGSDGLNSSYINEAGNRMAFDSITAFYHLSSDYFSDECINNPIDAKKRVWNQTCKNDADSAGIKLTEFPYLDAYAAAYNDQDVNKLLSWDILNYTIKSSNKGDVLMFDYQILLTTIGGGFLAYIFLIFCFDIAVRAVRLSFLQLIAPIPLISKIDPKKGDEVFNKWVKDCFSTYLSLFIRLAAVYFAIYMISIVQFGGVDVTTGADTTNVLAKLFIIFGILLFAKELPKLIESLTGIKLDSNGLSFRKRLGSVPILGAPTAALGGLALRTGLNVARRDGKAIGRDFKSTFGALGNSALNSVGILDRKLDRLEANEAAIMDSQAEKRKMIDRRKNIADSVKTMEDRAIERIKTGAAGKLSERYEFENTHIDKVSNMTDMEFFKFQTANAYDSNGNIKEDFAMYDDQGNFVRERTHEEYVAYKKMKLNKWLISNESDGATSQYIDGVINGQYIDSNNQIIMADFSDGTMSNTMYASYKENVEKMNVTGKNGQVLVPTSSAKDMHAQLAEMKALNGEDNTSMIQENQNLKEISDEMKQTKKAIDSTKEFRGSRK